MVADPCSSSVSTMFCSLLSLFSRSNRTEHTAANLLSVPVDNRYVFVSTSIKGFCRRETHGYTIDSVKEVNLLTSLEIL